METYTEDLARQLRNALRGGVLAWGGDPIPIITDLVRLGAIPVVVDLMRTAHPGVLRELIESWVAEAPDSVVPLLALFDQPNLETRLWAAEALGRIRAPGAGQRLCRRLRDGNQDTRLSAAVALGFRGDDAALDALLQGLQHPDPAPRAAAVRALGVLGAVAAPALARLRELATDPDWETRMACADAIRQIEVGLMHAPAELEAAEAPGGRGTELEAGKQPAGRGSELEAGTPAGPGTVIGRSVAVRKKRARG